MGLCPQVRVGEDELLASLPLLILQVKAKEDGEGDESAAEDGGKKDDDS